jgi:hypothetical protein
LRLDDLIQVEGGVDLAPQPTGLDGVQQFLLRQGCQTALKIGSDDGHSVMS